MVCVEKVHSGGFWVCEWNGCNQIINWGGITNRLSSGDFRLIKVRLKWEWKRAMIVAFGGGEFYEIEVF